MKSERAGRGLRRARWGSGGFPPSVSAQGLSGRGGSGASGEQRYCTPRSERAAAAAAAAAAAGAAAAGAADSAAALRAPLSPADVQAVSLAAAQHAHEQPSLWHVSRCPAPFGALLLAPAAVAARAPVLERPSCAHRVCAQCGALWRAGLHEGRSCGEARAARAAALLYTADPATRALLRATSRPCPRCARPTERNGGCLHMTCPCGVRWNWCCGTLGHEGHPTDACNRGGEGKGAE